MQNLVQIAGSVCLVVATAAAAQTPSSQPSAGGTPDKMPFDIPYGTTIGLDTAKRLLEIAEAEAKKHDWKMNIAVVDTHGELLAFERMDGAQFAVDRDISEQSAHVGKISSGTPGLLQSV